MDSAYHLLGIAIAWAAICLFWLVVNVVDGWVQRNIYPKLRARFPRTAALLGKQIGRRHSTFRAKDLSGPRRIR